MHIVVGFTLPDPEGDYDPTRDGWRLAAEQRPIELPLPPHLDLSTPTAGSDLCSVAEQVRTATRFGDSLPADTLAGWFAHHWPTDDPPEETHRPLDIGDTVVLLDADGAVAVVALGPDGFEVRYDIRGRERPVIDDGDLPRT